MGRSTGGQPPRAKLRSPPSLAVRPPVPPPPPKGYWSSRSAGGWCQEEGNRARAEILTNDKWQQGAGEGRVATVPACLCVLCWCYWSWGRCRHKRLSAPPCPSYRLGAAGQGDNETPSIQFAMVARQSDGDNNYTPKLCTHLPGTLKDHWPGGSRCITDGRPVIHAHGMGACAALRATSAPSQTFRRASGRCNSCE